MKWNPPQFWQPDELLRHVESRESSTQVVVVRTSLGDGYVKSMGNPQGEHALAREWVGTLLAHWLGLPTFQFGIINVKEDELAMLPFLTGNSHARAGPAFITKAEPGEVWSGKKRELERLVNRQDLTNLVILDTWIRNQDRYFPRPAPQMPRIRYNNVFLSHSAPAGQLLLRAMDHSECFTNGRDLVPRHLGIDQAQDSAVYGLFPEFRGFLNREAAKATARRLAKIDVLTAEAMVSSIPKQWDVHDSGRKALVNFIVDRAVFLSTRIESFLWPQSSLFEEPLETPP